jgi:outer membrane lipoprotein-sorting protein
MQPRRWIVSVAAVAAISAGLTGTAGAQAVNTAAPQTWSQTVTKEPAPGEFDSKQTELIQKLTAYFNEMGDMKGEFQQISPDGKRLRGNIYVKRPSFFRFEYRRPSRQLIISDGKQMIVLDRDLKTDSRYGLDTTPFRIVMRKDVDLLRDSKVLEIGESEDRIHISLQDKSSDTVGKLKLSFLKAPVIELKEWVTTDQQGLETRVELTEFAKAEKLDDKLFVPDQVALEKLKQ